MLQTRTIWHLRNNLLSEFFMKLHGVALKVQDLGDNSARDLVPGAKN